MLTKSEAIARFKESLPPEEAMVEDRIVERDYGWVLFSQSKKYLETRDRKDMQIGSGGTLVEKATGRFIEFGSAHSTEVNLHIYEGGYLDCDNWDLLVTSVARLEEAVDLVDALRLTYVEPELVSGIVWRVPQHYSHSRVRQKLEVVPCRFHLGGAYLCWETLEAMKSSTALRFELVPNQGHCNKA